MDKFFRFYSEKGGKMEELERVETKVEVEKVYDAGGKCCCGGIYCAPGGIQ